MPIGNLSVKFKLLISKGLVINEQVKINNKIKQHLGVSRTPFFLIILDLKNGVMATLKHLLILSFISAFLKFKLLQCILLHGKQIDRKFIH